MLTDTAVIKLNANQMKMLEHLAGATAAQPFDLRTVFSMKDDGNRRDCAQLGHAGYTDGSAEAGWLTAKGKQALL